ncbi:MAG: DUF4907 domain-containing protein [Arcticibacter sp.]
MRTHSLFISFTLLLFSCGGIQKQQDEIEAYRDTSAVEVDQSKVLISDSASDAKVEIQNFEVVTFQNKTSAGGWGFDVYVDGKRYIHQPIVPVVAGDYGFRTKEQSEMAGNMMVEKLKQGKQPPALDENDLRFLGIQMP